MGNKKSKKKRKIDNGVDAEATEKKKKKKQEKEDSAEVTTVIAIDDGIVREDKKGSLINKVLKRKKKKYTLADKVKSNVAEIFQSEAAKSTRAEEREEIIESQPNSDVVTSSMEEPARDEATDATREL